MGDTTTHGAPFPVGTDRVMDGDNAIKALAEWVDGRLYAASAPSGALAPGVWQNATVTVCTSTTLAAQPGTAIARARWMKIGNTVWFQGDAAVGSTAIVDVAISLPNAQAGVPQARILDPGTCVLVDGSGAPNTQTGQCLMGVGKDRIIPISPTGGYVDATATSSIRWSVVYEVLT